MATRQEVEIKIQWLSLGTIVSCPAARLFANFRSAFVRFPSAETQGFCLPSPSSAPGPPPRTSLLARRADFGRRWELSTPPRAFQLERGPEPSAGAGRGGDWVTSAPSAPRRLGRGRCRARVLALPGPGTAAPWRRPGAGPSARGLPSAEQPAWGERGCQLPGPSRWAWGPDSWTAGFGSTPHLESVCAPQKCAELQARITRITRCRAREPVRLRGSASGLCPCAPLWRAPRSSGPPSVGRGWQTQGRTDRDCVFIFAGHVGLRPSYKEPPCSPAFRYCPVRELSLQGRQVHREPLRRQRQELRELAATVKDAGAAASYLSRRCNTLQVNDHESVLGKFYYSLHEKDLSLIRVK
ncbi:PREDICTED: uncharacterized protein LOC106148625 [Chinchilla lanigera]|uniref:uncharacterized protein LOC106148625 n=1 Tax=Chinchilla lanigera TaxID=34839 RepID=UPI000698A049|nr:PREDICTED: uncharacterized protein LOC106148625 [Chinchilla lanigera]